MHRTFASGLRPVLTAQACGLPRCAGGGPLSSRSVRLRERHVVESPSVKRVTTSNYRTDPHYPRIVRAAAAILAKAKVIAPVEIFVHIDLLHRDDLDRWRSGRVPYLEQVMRCNFVKASRIPRILRMHAHDLNLRASHTAYVSYGKRPRASLRFSKTGVPALENAYSLHFGRVTSKRRLRERAPRVREPNRGIHTAAAARPRWQAGERESGRGV